MPIIGNIDLKVGTTSARPAAGNNGTLFFNSDYDTLQIDAGTKWNSIGVRDGSSYYNSASSAQAIKDLTGTTTNGTYWIDVAGTPTQIYCDMNTNGGGWMSFASHPASSTWFGGDTGLAQAWATLGSYSYGTYASNGSIGNYWRDWSQQEVSQLLFKTGNGTYWIVINISDVYQAPNNYSYVINSVASSNNFPADATYQANTKVTIMHRSPNNGEDPWINAGTNHANGNEQVAWPNTTDYMFWGENGYAASHYHFKSGNGGILAFVR